MSEASEQDRLHDQRAAEVMRIRKLMRCDHPGCKAQAVFGWDGKHQRCGAHLPPEMKYGDRP